MPCPQSSIAPRRRRWALGLVGAVLTATIALVADPVAADPIEDQRQRVTELTDELERLAEASDILAEEFVTAIDEQRRLESEVVVAEQQVAERQGEVDALRSELGAVAVQTFMGAGTNGLGPMLDDSQAYTEQLQRDQLARVALSSGDATTDQLDVAVEDLKAQRSALEDKQAAAVAAAADVEAAKRENDAKKAEYENARTGAESELGRLIQEEEERRARESYERMVREAEEAAARAAAEAAAQQAEADAAAAAEAQQQADAAASADAQAADAQAIQAAPQTPDEPDDEAPAPEAADDQSSGGGGGGGGGDEADEPAPAPAPAQDDDDDGDDDGGSQSSGGGGSSSAVAVAEAAVRASRTSRRLPHGPARPSTRR